MKTFIEIEEISVIIKKKSKPESYSLIYIYKEE
jgi:hypothetical protein